MLLSRLFLSIFCTILIQFVSASNIPRDEPSIFKSLKKKIFTSPKPRTNESLVGEDVELIPFSSKLETSDDLVKEEFKFFSLLSDDLIQKIFEYSLDASVREVSKEFLKIYDDLIFKIRTRAVPFFTKASLTLWTHNENLKYQLIPLAKVLHFDVKPLLIKISVPEYVTDISLRNNAINLINAIRIIDVEAGLKLTNSLLKLEIVEWHDVYDLFFSGNSMSAIMKSWILGLTTIAHEMIRHNYDLFIDSIGPINMGFVPAIHKKHYALSKIIVSKICYHGRQFFQDATNQYFCEVMLFLINSEYWDLVRQLHETEPNYFNEMNFGIIAEKGSIEGLHIFHDIGKIRPDNFACNAAKYGQLEFLKEMDAMNLFNVKNSSKESFFPAFEAAILHNKPDCLDFLVEKFGTKCLSSPDHGGYMAIHKVAESGDSETLRTIIKHHPHYFKPKSRFSYFFGSAPPVISPLNLAVEAGKEENVKVLLEHFPELISFKDNQVTVLHKSGLKEFNCFDTLFEFAPPEIIAAQDSSQCNILHIAAAYRDLGRIVQLMSTGLFTGTERANNGWTPVYIYWISNSNAGINVSNSELMTLFNLQTEEQLAEALQ